MNAHLLRWPLSIAALGLCLLLPAPRAGAQKGDTLDEKAGTKLFNTLECSECHSMKRFAIEATPKSEKLRGEDLSAAGSKHDAEWIKAWLRRETDLEGDKHKGRWKGNDKQLDQIACWLASLEES